MGFATQTQKCAAVFATQKALNLPCVALQNAMQTLRIATQIQKCVAVFATLKKRTKIKHSQIRGKITANHFVNF